jgi:hypothetical protein
VIDEILDMEEHITTVIMTTTPDCVVSSYTSKSFRVDNFYAFDQRGYTKYFGTVPVTNRDAARLVRCWKWVVSKTGYGGNCPKVRRLRTLKTPELEVIENAHKECLPSPELSAQIL